MNSDAIREIYERGTFGQAIGRGQHPAILVVDFQYAFTDPASRLGSDLTAEVEATKVLLDVARSRELPVVFTAIGFDEGGTDGALWLRKVPALEDLEVGGRWVEIDPRLGRRDQEPVLIKKGASAFHGTNLVAILVSQLVDSVILCGAATSGCVRATAIDLLQNGFPTMVPRECVGDRARGPHEASLFDIHAKYADVVALQEAISHVESLVAEGRPLPLHPRA